MIDDDAERARGSAHRRPMLLVVGEHVVTEVQHCTCARYAGVLPGDDHAAGCGLEPVIGVEELAALGFIHTEQTELHRRALRAVQRYAHNMPGPVAEVIREALGQSRPEWNRPALRDELVAAAIDWAAAVGTVVNHDPAAENRAELKLREIVDRYRQATADPDA